MFGFIKDREQEIALLKFAKLEAKCNKHNIAEAKKLSPDLRANNEIHKTKTKERQVIVNRWIKEQKNLKKFFVAHQKEGTYERYKYRKTVTPGRNHLKDYFDGRTET